MDAKTCAFNMQVSELCIMVPFDIQYNIRILIFVRMEIHVNNCVMQEGSYVITV